MEIKTRILELLNEMHDDSKIKSNKAERELCKILTNFINKLNAFDEALDAYIHHYPNRIYTVESEYKYKKLPEEIYCNDGDFTFETEWLDVNWEERFNSVITGKISYLKGLIERVEATVVEHKKNLKKYSDMTFDNVKHIIED